MMGKVVIALQKRVDGGCESTGVNDEFHPGDVGDEPNRRTGYRASSELG
jgi:hypothetical protein